MNTAQFTLYYLKPPNTHRHTPGCTVYCAFVILVALELFVMHKSADPREHPIVCPLFYTHSVLLTSLIMLCKRPPAQFKHTHTHFYSKCAELVAMVPFCAHVHTTPSRGPVPAPEGLYKTGTPGALNTPRKSGVQAWGVTEKSTVRAPNSTHT